MAITPLEQETINIAAAITQAEREIARSNGEVDGVAANNLAHLHERIDNMERIAVGEAPQPITHPLSTTWSNGYGPWQPPV